MIIKRHHTGGFAVVPNSTADDPSLDAVALGILVHLLAKPHDWTVNVTALARRFDMHENTVYKVLKRLMAAGYVERTQRRDDMSRRFVDVEYIVYDVPRQNQEEGEADEDENIATTPVHKICDAGKPQQIAASQDSAKRKSVTLLKTNSTNPFQGKSSALTAGADAPSLNKQVWGKGAALLSQSPSRTDRAIIGKWISRVGGTEDAKTKLLAIIERAIDAGTADPIGYVTAALNAEFGPPLKDWRKFTREDWEAAQRAVIKTKDWSISFGPPPGAKCGMPPDLLTPELKAAVALARRVA